MLKFLALPLTLLTLITFPTFGQSTLGGGTVGIPGLTTNAVRERHLKAVDAPADEECLTYESTVGDFEWQNCIAGAMTDVVDDVTPQLGGPLDTNDQAINLSEGTPVASDTTTDIWATDGNTIHVTGVTTITSFGTAPRVGASRVVIFDGALILTHSANLALPGSANITTAAGDIAFVYADSTTQFDVLYARVDGTALAITANSIDFTEIVNAATLDGNFSIAAPAANNIVIDSRTAPSTHTQGIMRYEHTAAAVNTRVIELEVDAASFASTHAVRADLHATALAPGEVMIGYHVSADTSTSTGGMIEAVRVDKAGAGSADVHALHIDPGVDVIHQESGTFGALESAWENAVEVTSELNDTGTDLTLFSSNSDILYIGDAAAFNALEVNLDTVAGGAGIKPTFEFSDDGGGGWDTFTPVDGTDGFRETGIIEWTIADLTNWQTDTVNAVANKFWIRITRTQASIPQDPIEDTIQISKTIEHGWDEDGNLSVNTGDFAGDVTMASGTQVFLDTGIAALPSLTDRTNPDTGIYFSGNDINISINEVNRFGFVAGTFRAINGVNGGALLQETASTINPTVIPGVINNMATGMGSGGANELSLIADSIEGIRIEEASSHILISYETHVGLTANSGGGGVGSCLQLLSSYNEVPIVGAAGDSVCLPTAAIGKTVFIINNDSTDAMDVYPFTDDNLGGGVNTAVSLAAGSNIRYFAIDGVNWEVM
ncbi:hypothetical protein LCGC14_0896040 [marine sediment metagenome]|uniref:Uncharacterized protein n=1 Tax=marine sediment metagenome TaxID=412755 RepID=A0A0F9NY07_9ZZZZ